MIPSPFHPVIISALIASRCAGMALLCVTFAGLKADFIGKLEIREADQKIDEVSDINHIICEEMQNPRF